MFCDSESEEASVHRMVVVATVVSLLPLVAFLYPLIVYGVYASMHEIHWTDAKSLKSIFLRFILLAISILASCGIVTLCGACGETIPDQQTWWCLVGATALVGTIVGVVSVKLMVATRREDVVGVDEVPFYGSKALAGKFMVVTGANNGIGFETTRQLAAQGATIALLCRNPKRATKAIEDIIDLQEQLHAKDPILYPTPSISKDQLIFVPVDLTDFESIRQAAKAVEQLLKQQKTSFVDALICNAGMFAIGVYLISRGNCIFSPCLFFFRTHDGHSVHDQGRPGNYDAGKPSWALFVDKAHAGKGNAEDFNKGRG